MIVFDLQCGDAGHVFEAWFGSSDDYADQKASGLVTCPICGSGKIEKALMAPAVGTKGNRKEGPGQTLPVAKGEQNPAKMKELLGKLAKEQAKALEKSDYVGSQFATEARAMHEGESDERAIHGETTLEDAKSLIDDGVPVSPLPFPVRPPNSDN
ncbi:MAG: DUF1178 family protein [Sphingomonadaceae bacterium]|nr:DUF1178 family protein [Sphingomonadaceae bacterium]